MSEPRRPSLPFISSIVKPGRLRSTRNMLMPRCPASGLVLVTMQKTSALSELVMKILEPVSRQPEPSRTARVWIPATLLPAPGSVIPSAATLRPATRSGKILLLFAPACRI